MTKPENALKNVFYHLPKHFVQIVTRSFWFVPGLLGVGALIAAILFNTLDRYIQIEPNGSLGWLYSNSAEGARSLLSIISGSMITVTGVLLSAMIVVMTLASQQYGPRLVQNFIEDRASQTVIGCFVGCFVYSVITLKTIQSGEYAFIPHLSILGALIFTILCMALMLYFVHHVSSAIQVQAIMRRVYMRLTKEIETLFPQGIGQTADSSIGSEETRVEQMKTDYPESAQIPLVRSGYLQSIEHEKLLEISSKHDFVIFFKATPGDFLINGASVAEVRSASAIDESVTDKVQAMFLIGTFPNNTQDILFPIRQLEEIAIRALSPGINDPHTAVEAIDYLGSALAQLAERDQPSSLRLDTSQNLRMVIKSPGFEDILHHAYQQIHHYGQTDVTIINQLFASLEAIKERAASKTDKVDTIARFKEEIFKKSLHSITAEADQRIIKKAYAHAE